MDETPGFDASQLQALVLDEADRILDMVNLLQSNPPRRVFFQALPRIRPSSDHCFSCAAAASHCCCVPA